MHSKLRTQPKRRPRNPIKERGITPIRHHKGTSVSVSRTHKRRKKDNRPRLVILGWENILTYFRSFGIEPWRLTWRQKLHLWWNDQTDWSDFYAIALTLLAAAMIMASQFISWPKKKEIPVKWWDQVIIEPFDSSQDPKYGPWTEPSVLPENEHRPAATPKPTWPPTPIYTPNKIIKHKKETEFIWQRSPSPRSYGSPLSAPSFSF